MQMFSATIFHSTPIGSSDRLLFEPDHRVMASRTLTRSAQRTGPLDRRGAGCRPRPARVRDARVPAAFRRARMQLASLWGLGEPNERRKSCVWGQFQIPPGRYEAMDDPATPSSFSKIYPTLLIEPQRSKEWLLTAIPLHPGKEALPDNPLFRSPRFRVRRYSNSSRAQSTVLRIGLKVEHQPTWS